MPPSHKIAGLDLILQLVQVDRSAKNSLTLKQTELFIQLDKMNHEKMVILMMESYNFIKF